MAGVDGSVENLAAAEWASREAARRVRPLCLVHAWNRPPRKGTGPCAAVGRRCPARRCPARRALRQAEDRVRRTCPGLEAEAEPVEEPAADALLHATERAGLLVLGSRGLSGFTGFVVGSVALGVVAPATLPVVLVSAGEEASDERLAADDGSPSTRTGYQDVALGLDLGDPCGEVIEFAFEAARPRGARLHVGHASQEPSQLGLGPGAIGLVSGPEQADEWLGFLDAVIKVWRDRYPWIEVVGTVTEGCARSVPACAASGAGPLVVGRRTTERPAGPRTGPVTHAVVQHVGRPVAVVPHE